jgi:hypothetical protein
MSYIMTHVFWFVKAIISAVEGVRGVPGEKL